AGGGLGNAVLFSIGKAMRAKGNKVIYFAGYKKPEDVYKIEEIEAASDVIVWSVDAGDAIQPRRPEDKTFVGNIVQAMISYSKGELGDIPISLKEVNRIIAIGSDRMMEAVKTARHTSLAPYLNPDHVGIGSINSPMQCMMKEVCAQCLQKHVDPATGEETDPVFSCFNQDQKLDCVDFSNLRARLKQNSVQEKLSGKMLDLLMEKKNIMRV
ncbi:MAG: pyridine nucleotide-disulfide oxidoreductase, partial [Nitrospiria bacterium]